MDQYRKFINLLLTGNIPKPNGKIQVQNKRMENNHLSQKKGEEAETARLIVDL